MADDLIERLLWADVAGHRYKRRSLDRAGIEEAAAALSSKDKALEEMRAELERARALLDSIIARDDRNGSLPEWYRHEIDANYERPNPPSEGDGN